MEETSDGEEEAGAAAGGKKKSDIYDDESDFQSEEEDQVFSNDKKIDYHSYKYTVSQSNADLKHGDEHKDLTIRKLQYVTVRNSFYKTIIG